jgi:hypothetical protein
LGCAQRAHVKKKGELDDALAEIANTKRTTHSLIGDVLRARRYNRVLGLSIFSPWTVNEIDEESAAVFDALDELDKDAADRAKAKQEFDNVLARQRAKSGYRSYAK